MLLREILSIKLRLCFTPEYIDVYKASLNRYIYLDVSNSGHRIAFNGSVTRKIEVGKERLFL